jgi:hypothetical protein
MSPRELFEAWAPPSSVWSPWAKPVLFAHMEGSRARSLDGLEATPEVDCSWAGSVAAGTALILELPGSESVPIAAALALRGFRPVPLFNTTPGPAPVVVEVRPTMAALARYAGAVAASNLSSDAPPAFMLDSLRLKTQGRTEGAYDNRWAVFEQDFPSANFLHARGIHQVLLVAPTGGTEPDLARILSTWRRQGLSLLFRPDHGTPKIEPLTPRTILNWRLAAFAAMLALGLRRNATGGFGSRIPVASSGGGGYS